MSNGARRRFLRAYSVRIARSPSPTSSFSRRVTPTEPDDISRFRGTTCRKVDPAWHAALSKRCFHLGACFHLPVSLIIRNSRTLQNTQVARRGPGRYSVHSPGAGARGARGLSLTSAFRGSVVWSLTPPVGPRDTNARRVLALTSFEPLRHNPTKLN